MKPHKWTEADFKLLEKNVTKCGVKKGCVMTAKKIGTTTASASTMYYQKIKKLTKHGIPVTHPEKLENIQVEEPVRQRKPKRHLSQEDEMLFAECIKNRVRNSDDGICKILNDMAKIFDVSYRTAEAKWNGENGYTGSLYKYTMFTEEELDSLLNRKKRVTPSSENEIEIAQYLKEKIAENPNNLKVAFKDTQEHFGFRNIASIVYRWYGYKGYKDYPSCKDNMGPVYTVVGNNATINGKNKSTPDVKKTNWIMNIFRKWINKGKK